MTVPMPAVPRIMLGAFKLSQFLIGMLLTQTMFWVLGWMGVPNTDNTFPCRVWSLKWITACWILQTTSTCYFFHSCGWLWMLCTLFFAASMLVRQVVPIFIWSLQCDRSWCISLPCTIVTNLILCFLSGEQFEVPAVAVSLLATGYVPFIKSHILRSDIDCSLY